MYSYRHRTRIFKMSLFKKSQSVEFYDTQDYWKCQGPHKTIIPDSGATKQCKTNSLFGNLMLKVQALNSQKLKKTRAAQPSGLVSSLPENLESGKIY